MADAPVQKDDVASFVAAIRSLEDTVRDHKVALSHMTDHQSANHSAHAQQRLPSPAKTKNQGPKKATKETVFIRVVFLKIGEIDTLKEKFTADVFIQGRWREPALDGTTDQDPEKLDWAKIWTPQLYVDNVIGDAKHTTWYSVNHDDRGYAIVYEKHRITGTFLECLELNQFPFDTQDLTITVTTERSELEVALEEDHSELCAINVQSFVDEQEWRLHTHIETRLRITTKMYRNCKYKHPALSAACKASRRAGFFIWNIFFVMLFICGLAFCTFTVKYNLPQNRLQLSFILLLTTVTFKFVVNQSLPRISYLTYLDKYILTSMTLLCSVCIWHAIVPLIKTPDDAITADRWAFGVLGSTFLLFHVLFFGWIFFQAKRKSSKIHRKDAEHEAKANFLERLHESFTKIDNLAYVWTST